MIQHVFVLGRHGAAAVLVLALLASAVLPPALAGAQTRTLTIDDIFDPVSRVDFDGNAPFGLSWVDDEHYVERGRGNGDGPMKVHAVTGERTPLFDLTRFETALDDLPGVTAAQARRLSRQTTHRWNANRTALMFDLWNDLYYYELGDDRVRRLTRTPETEEVATFSPDGRLVAFVRARNLVVVDVDHRREHALTTDGGGAIRNGLLDWVYQEEIYGRGDFQGYWWSPDSTRIAYLRLDDSNVPTYTVLDHIPYRPEVENWDYPKAGDPNPAVRLGVVRSAGGDTRWIDTAAYQPQQPLIVNVSWSPDSSDVIFQIQDREQTWLDLNASDRATGVTRRLLRETTDAWVNELGPPRWLADGTFLWMSERTGWKHLYHYRADGTLIRQVTDGDWEARTLHGVDESAGWIYFSGTERSPIGGDVYRVGLDGTALTRLSETEGTHAARFNPSLTHYIDTWSDLVTPPQARLHGVDGAVVRVIDANPVGALRDYALSQPELLQIPNRDGFLMEALMIKPPDFDPSRRYPVYQHIYGGPHAPRVANRWGGSTGLFWQLLAQRGVIVWVLDNATASGKGAISTWPLYQRFGELELRDQEDGIAWLTAQPYVDADRIGIEGWSYGGFMVSYALTHSDRWSMGIAGGPVTDWRDYDSVYTERLMRMPQNNPDGYRDSSPRFKAADLNGALLLVHGTMDENVHMQNTLQFAYELQKAGKRFEMMVYPRSRHRLGDPDLEKHRHLTMLDFVMRHLAPTATRTPSSTSARR